MAEEELKKAKNLRAGKLGSFTRKQNRLQKLLDGGVEGELLVTSFGELKEAYNVLETAHENLLLLLEVEGVTAEDAYMDDPSDVLTDFQVKIAQSDSAVVARKEKARADKEVTDRKDSFSKAVAKFKLNIESFGKPSVSLSQLTSENKISFADMRQELVKIESTYAKLVDEKAKISESDPSADLTEESNLFKSKVVDEVERCKIVGLEYLKADTSSASSSEASGRSSSVSSSYSSTKRETVMLPKFSGDEKTAFLKYPVWKQQWSSQINEYEEKYRATMLINHLDSKAQEQIVGLENDYEQAIEELDRYYSDARKIVKACLEEIRGHSTISPFDYKALVAYKKCLVNQHARLKAADLEHEMSNTAALGVLIRKFPIQEAVKWQEFLAKQSATDQAKPFPAFMKWLAEAGASWELLAAAGTGVKGKNGAVQVHHSFFGDSEEVDSRSSKKCHKCGEEGHWKRECKKSGGKGARVTGGGGVRNRDPPKHKKYHCALHKDSPTRSCYTWSCGALKYVPAEERIKLLKENGDCKLCCGDCPKDKCQKGKRTCGGNKEGRGCGTAHVGHELFCQKAKLCFSTQIETVLQASDRSEDGVLLQVMKIPSISPDLTNETVLWDSACSGMFVREDHARKMGFSFTERRLLVKTLGGEEREIDGRIYSCKIQDQNGKIYKFSAHGLEQVTGSLGNPLGKAVMKEMFPDLIGGQKLSEYSDVDYLIGLGKASWHPERLLRAKGGGDFWLWENSFGVCLGGSHPLVNSFTSRSEALYTVLKTIVRDPVVEDSLKIPLCNAFAVKTLSTVEDDFFSTEQLGTVVEPKCGACRCGKCPVPGSRYSFREESELKLIEESLTYDEENKCWVASYPYLFPKESLKGTKEVAFKSLLSSERSLAKNESWGAVYQSQIDDMVQRGAARIVPAEELSDYKGHINYLPHLAALNPRSQSTPVRICFDASRAQGGGPSLNQILAKGPDCFLNNLAGVILNFRNGRVAAKGDVKKMYNTVKLQKEDAFLQCFLWRNLDTSREPDTYQVTVNNIGVKPAGAIATVAMRKSANVHKEEFPVTASQIKDKSYVDDLGLTGKNHEELDTRTKEADTILAHAGMKVKKWICSGVDEGSVALDDVAEIVPIDSNTEVERMLGVMWEPKKDVFKFKVRINLSPLKNKSRTGPDLSAEELRNNPPTKITRRQYYSNIQSLYDPIGLLSPVLLEAKLLLRRTWEGENVKLSWDDPLPDDLAKDIVDFFASLYELESLEFSRSLWPKEKVVGLPDLIIFSDGSKLAFGAVAYIRWKLETGKWWPMLIMSKSKIGPKNLLTIPRLELNGAVTGNRLKEFITKQLGIKFGNIYHLVDSSTVLGYIHKADAKLKPFEGVRVSEIQTSGTFENGRLKNWSWVEGKSNPADWATKPRAVKDLAADGFWQRGPDFLKDDYETWPIRHDFRTDRLEGELQPKSVHMVMATSVFEDWTQMDSLLQNVSTLERLLNATAYILKWRKIVSKDESKELGKIDSALINKARTLWIKYVQLSVVEELRKSVSQDVGVKVHGSYRRLSPFLDDSGIWRVGSRLRDFTPFTQDQVPPAFLPKDSRFTYLVMLKAHQKKHSGVDETVAQFRMMGFWTTQANRLAKSIKGKCVTCRLLDKRPEGQVMGGIPKEQLVNPIAWGHVEMDLFGPFLCRGEVNKRTSKKVWGIVLVDRNSGAVHCDIVLDYSAQETIKALRRFAALRGWPSKFYSDPGSQLESSSGDLESWWTAFRDPLVDTANEKSFSWEISPANSPWRQGRCEVRIKLLKRLIKLSMGESRLTPSEFQTVLFEVANLSNERPIGVVKTPKSDGTFNVLTPNSLLMGRSTNAVPDDSNLALHMKKSERYELIQQVTSDFWYRWTQQVTPEAVIRQQWHEKGRNLKIGDIVLVHDKSMVKGKYTLAVVDSVKVSDDELVRSCTVSYTIPKPNEPANRYSGGKRITLTRSIQRLTLLLPVEEQTESLNVVDNSIVSIVEDEA